MIKVYLAAPYTEKVNMPEYAKQVEAAGLHITHKWWEVEEANVDKYSEYALDDINGVVESDRVILFNSAVSEGKALEQGIAIMEGIPIIGVGKPGQHYPDGKSYTNIFHTLSSYVWVDTLKEAIQVVKEGYDETVSKSA